MTDEKVICVGRLEAVKAFQYAVMAITIAKVRFPNIHLTIVGQGSEREKLEEFSRQLGVEQNISFQGTIAHDRMQSFMEQHNLLLQTSLSEGFPNVILEAMSVGLPVIATNVGGTPDLVRDGLDGFLVPSRNPKAMAARIVQMFEDGDLRERMGMSGKEQAEKFSWEHVIEGLERIYASLLMKNRHL